MKVDRRRKYWLVLDTETSQKGLVIDFAAVIVDRNGKVYSQCAVILGEVFYTQQLFNGGHKGVFAIENLKARHDAYLNMIANGQRMLANAGSINKWLTLANEAYAPVLTAYHLPFDERACKKTEIDISVFEQRFCLWREAAGTFARTRKYVRFCLNNKFLSEKLNFLTNAEVMCHYLTGDDTPEPHTALEDCLFYEIPILVKWIKQKKGIKNQPYNWRNHQLMELVATGGKKFDREYPPKKEKK